MADLHMELLGYGPMAGLGRSFVREVCYRCHMKDGVLQVKLAEVEGEPAGFVAFTPFSLSFHRSGLRRHSILAGWLAMRAVVTQPRRLARLLRALRVLASRRQESRREDVPVGEVVCIAVRARFLKADFVHVTGIRLSQLLVRQAAECLSRCGVREMRMLADADNKPVLMLYHLLGARFRNYSLGGEPVIEAWFDLSDKTFAPTTNVPLAWQYDAAADVGTGGGWTTYWEEISDDKEVFRAEAEDYAERLLRAVPMAPCTTVLDFGCGFGFAAQRLAPHVAQLALWDEAANVRRKARLRTGHLSNVVYVDLSSPEKGLPKIQFDLIAVHSVLQYMRADEIRAWLRRWRTLLRPDGQLVLSDLIQPDTSAWQETVGYLRFSVRRRFVGNALVQGVRELAHYCAARHSHALTPIPLDTLTEWASSAGFQMRLLPENLSYRTSRAAVILRPTA